MAESVDAVRTMASATGSAPATEDRLYMEEVVLGDMTDGGGGDPNNRV